MKRGALNHFLNQCLLVICLLMIVDLAVPKTYWVDVVEQEEASEWDEESTEETNAKYGDGNDQLDKDAIPPIVHFTPSELFSFLGQCDRPQLPGNHCFSYPVAVVKRFLLFQQLKLDC